jgi:hypothetical protein
MSKWHNNDCKIYADDNETILIGSLECFIDGNPQPVQVDIAHAEQICRCVSDWDGLVKQRDKLLGICSAAKTVFQDIRNRHLKSSFHNNRVKSDCEEAIKFLEQAEKKGEL